MDELEGDVEGEEEFEFIRGVWVGIERRCGCGRSTGGRGRAGNVEPRL